MPTAILPPQTSQTTNGKYGHEATNTNGAHKMRGNVLYPKDISRPISTPSPPSSTATSTPSISASLGSINTVLASTFLEQYSEAHEYIQGTKPLLIDGHTLSLAAVNAAARYGTPVLLDSSSEVKARVKRSKATLDDKLRDKMSIYGVSTGYGGSADTRTDSHNTLGASLFQHQHIGVLSTSSDPSVLPLNDPLATTSMPESFVRAAMAVRANSLIRGHSAVRWELLECLTALLNNNITPLVPLRGSISASGDLSPLSYVAGVMTGNPAIRAYCGESTHRRIVSAPTALEGSGLQPFELESKEFLGLLNGTAFSAGVAALALSEAAFLALLSQVCTAMGTEALLGTRASFHPFIHDVARPHESQIEVARVLMRLLDGSKFASEAEEAELTTAEDKGELRQDRYPLRTAPQFIGPQLDDIASAIKVVTLECNSTTDNPLIDAEASRIHHGGNFQGMAVTNAMEKARLALHHLAKILFSQSTEMLNPAFNRGLPPSVAATDPSHNYHCKGVDIGMAAALSEIGYLANPVSTHIQSAEMHNQSVNSLALISARYTITTIDALSMLMASYIYILCQALDLRAMQMKFEIELNSFAAKHLFALFGPYLSSTTLSALLPELLSALHRSLDSTTTMDAEARLTKVAGAVAVPLLDTLAKHHAHLPAEAYASIQSFRQQIAKEGLSRLESLRRQFLNGERGQAPASEYMGRTKAVYEFVRINLGIQMHGKENLSQFADGLNGTELTIGHSITLIYEAIRDGQLQQVCAKLLAEL